MWIVTDRGDYAAETDIRPPIATVSLHYLFPARPRAPVLACVLSCSSAAMTCSVCSLFPQAAAIRTTLTPNHGPSPRLQQLAAGLARLAGGVRRLPLFRSGRDAVVCTDDVQVPPVC